MRFSSDRQRKAVFYNICHAFSQLQRNCGGCSDLQSDQNKFSYDESMDESIGFSNNSSFPSDSVLSSAPKYVYDKIPVDQFSMKSDLEGIRKSLKRVSDNPKFPAELRVKADAESSRVSDILDKQFVGKEDIAVEQLPKLEFVEEVKRQSIPTYEEVEEYLIKENIDPEKYYAGTHVPLSVYDVGVPSPAQEMISEGQRIRDEIKEGKIQLSKPVLTHIDIDTGAKTYSQWDSKSKKWMKI